MEGEVIVLVSFERKEKIKRKNKNYKKIKIWFFSKIYFVKYENDLTRRHFYAVGLAYADGKG
jgi:hypothetical protein